MIDLRLGNAYELIKEVEDNSVNLIVIDPPYAMQNFGDVATKGELFQHPAMKKLESSADTLRNGFDFSLFAEFERIQPFKNMYIFCNGILLQQLVSFFYPQGITCEILCWQKTNPIPSFRFHYMNDVEYCLYICDKKSTLDFGENVMQSGRASHFFVYPLGAKFTTHPTEKPLKWVENLILNSSREGELVLDCFAGSGTTAHACKKHNRRFIGFELDEEYYKMAQKRLENEVQGALFV